MKVLAFIGRSNNYNKYTLTSTLNIFIGIAEKLCEFHSLNISHGDIKLENVGFSNYSICKTDKGLKFEFAELVLFDYSHSSFVETNTPAYTEPFIPPEV